MIELTPDAIGALYSAAVIVVVLLVGIPLVLHDKRKATQLRASVAGSEDFVVIRGQNVHRARTALELLEWYVERRIQPYEEVYDPRSASWLRIRDLPEIAPMVQSQEASSAAQQVARSADFWGCIGTIISTGVGIIVLLVALFALVKLVKWIWYF